MSRRLSSTCPPVAGSSIEVSPRQQTPWGPIDEQGIRQQTYTGFRAEDEMAYTAGPAHTVVAHECVRADCSSLLMTLQLSAEIQKAVNAQRSFDIAEKLAAAEDNRQLQTSKN
ncbi:hypothetical protein EJ03DRAFT_324162 [Teratosphaeria nubilosa]|uniref:Uncharacterized protein n=1 Tax=Teratosphaeria nubilosa TaxID=161662 RepID=A0A6G1LJQ1_9PEZI|nr:hypothetical protein EJ03DRAFT_324162 [Teratosphaeria nubilosa]